MIAAPQKATCLARRFGTVALALLLAAALGATPMIALADEIEATPSDAPAAADASARPSPIQAGVMDALAALQKRTQRRGQDVLDEKALDYARRSDALAEQRALDALNARAQEAPLAKTSSKKHRNVLHFLGNYIPFEQGDSTDVAAPLGTASTWIGTGNVDDNQPTYFIGHNPGVFSPVVDLEIGDKVTVWDASGSSRTYYVFDLLTLPNASNYFKYEARIAPPGETITLQACCGDGKSIRCVMAR